MNRSPGLPLVVAGAALSLLAGCGFAGEEAPRDGVRLGDAVLAVQLSASGGAIAAAEGEELTARLVLVAPDGTARDVPSAPVRGGAPVWTAEALYAADTENHYRISDEGTGLTRTGTDDHLIAGVPSGVGDSIRWASAALDGDAPWTTVTSQMADQSSSGRGVGRAVHALATCDDGVYAVAGGLTHRRADTVAPEDLAAAAADEALVSFHIREWDASEQRGTSAPDDAASGTHTIAPCVDGVVHRLVYARADRARVTGDDAALVLRSWDTRVGKRAEVALHGGGVESLAEGDVPGGIQADAMSVVEGTMHWYDEAGGRLWATTLADGASRVVATVSPAEAEGAIVRVVFGPASALVLTIRDEVGAPATLSRVDLATGTSTAEMSIAALTSDALEGAPVEGIAVRPDLRR